MIDRERAEDIHARLYELNDYTEDQVKFGSPEHWEPGLNGDCEDYAMLLIRDWLEAGADRDSCGLAFVKVAVRGHAVGHAVAWIRIDGVLYYADCNSRWLRAMGKDQFEWISYMRMSDPTAWKAFK